MLPDTTPNRQKFISGPQGQIVFSSTYDLTVPRQKQPEQKKAENTDNSLAFDARKARFLLLASAAKLWPESRIKSCFRLIIPGQDMVDICYNEQQQKPRFSHLVRCGLGSCPVCGPWDRLRKGQVWAAMLKNPRYHVAMLTLTIAHGKSESFSDVYNRLKDASCRMFAGRWWQGFKRRYWVVGKLTSLEVTYGADNGFHPHYHIAVVSETSWEGDPAVTAWCLLYKRWPECVAKAGGFASEEYGVDFKAGNSGAVEYLTKLDGTDGLAQSWGIVQEVTLSDVKKAEKGHRTELQLLADYAIKGDIDAGQIWVEIAIGLAGQTRLKSSRGLWEELGGEEETEKQNDEWELLSETEIVLMSLCQTSWNVIWSRGLLAGTYEAAGQNDAVKLRQYLRENGVPFV